MMAVIAMSMIVMTMVGAGVIVAPSSVVMMFITPAIMPRAPHIFWIMRVADDNLMSAISPVTGILHPVLVEI